MRWQYVERDNRNVFDVRLCSAAGCIIVCHLLRANSTQRGKKKKMCLIKRIPLKSVIECWISFVGNVCENTGRRRAASVFEKLVMFDRQHGGHQHNASKSALSSSRQHKDFMYQRAVII